MKPGSAHSTAGQANAASTPHTVNQHPGRPSVCATMSRRLRLESARDKRADGLLGELALPPVAGGCAAAFELGLVGQEAVEDLRQLAPVADRDRGCVLV